MVGLAISAADLVATGSAALAVRSGDLVSILDTGAVQRYRVKGIHTGSILGLGVRAGRGGLSCGGGLGGLGGGRGSSGFSGTGGGGLDSWKCVSMNIAVEM